MCGGARRSIDKDEALQIGVHTPTRVHNDVLVLSWCSREILKGNTRHDTMGIEYENHVKVHSIEGNTTVSTHWHRQEMKVYQEGSYRYKRF